MLVVETIARICRNHLVIGLQEFGCGVAEAQALLDQPVRYAETDRNGGDGLTGLGEFRERDHLIGEVHRDADVILGERDFTGLDIAGLDQEGHGMIGIEDTVFDLRLHGFEASPAGDHGIALGAVTVRAVGADDEVFEQSERGDRGLELCIGLGIGRRLAHVLGGEGEPAQGNFPDERFSLGGDEVHAFLYGGLHRRGGDGALRPSRACPRSGPAPPPAGQRRDRRRCRIARLRGAAARSRRVIGSCVRREWTPGPAGPNQRPDSEASSHVEHASHRLTTADAGPKPCRVNGG